MPTRKTADVSPAPVKKTVGPPWNGTVGHWDSSRSPIDRIYIHSIDGTGPGADARFNKWPITNKGDSVSAHYGILLTGEIWQWVDEDATAYHAGLYAENQRSIGIEHEDNGNAYDVKRTDAQYASSAKLVANICKFYGLPADRVHIKKHSEAPAQTQCPAGLDIERIVREAAAILAGTPAPVPPQVSPPAQAPVSTVMYKGLDLTNQESMKVAVDTWAEVRDGLFIRKDPSKVIVEASFVNAICAALTIPPGSDQTKIIETIVTLKKGFEQQVAAVAKLPIGATPGAGGVSIPVEGKGPVITAAPDSGKEAAMAEIATILNSLHTSIDKLFGKK